MNPLDRVVQFISDARAAGVPDRLIYEGLQAALVEAAMLEMVSRQPTKPTKTPAKTIGFFNSNR